MFIVTEYAALRSHQYHIYINCWFPVYRWSVNVNTGNQNPPFPGIAGGGGVLITCLSITDHLWTGNQQLM